MVRSYAFNLHGYPVRTEITTTKQILTSHVCSMDKSKLKEFPVNETLLQSCSTDKDESKGIIVNECPAEDDEYKSKVIIVKKCSTYTEKT